MLKSGLIFLFLLLSQNSFAARERVECHNPNGALSTLIFEKEKFVGIPANDDEGSEVHLNGIKIRAFEVNFDNNHPINGVTFLPNADYSSGEITGNISYMIFFPQLYNAFFNTFPMLQNGTPYKVDMLIQSVSDGSFGIEVGTGISLTYSFIFGAEQCRISDVVESPTPQACIKPLPL